MVHARSNPTTIPLLISAALHQTLFGAAKLQGRRTYRNSCLNPSCKISAPCAHDCATATSLSTPKWRCILRVEDVTEFEVELRVLVFLYLLIHCFCTTWYRDCCRWRYFWSPISFHGFLKSCALQHFRSGNLTSFFHCCCWQYDSCKDIDKVIQQVKSCVSNHRYFQVQWYSVSTSTMSITHMKASCSFHVFRKLWYALE